MNIINDNNEKSIRALAENVAATYMNGKACDSREFIETFLDVRDAAIAMINVREEKKISSYNDMSNLSFGEMGQ